MPFLPDLILSDMVAGADILILSVGTEILYGPNLVPDSGWESFLNQGWNRDAVVEEAKKFEKLRFQVNVTYRSHVFK